MSATPQKKPDRTYTIVGPEAYRPPDYDRVVRGLTDPELHEEIAFGRGDLGYQDALRAERDRREAG